MAKKKQAARVVVKFKKSYIASRGPGISGQKGDEKQYPMSDALQQCCDDGICEVVREVKAAKRETAKKPAAKKA